MEYNNVIQLERNLCLFCGAKFHGRSDKKFCRDSCRNAFNNSARGQYSEEFRRINAALKKNHTVLLSILQQSDAQVCSEQLLLSNGFSFYYFTHHFEDEQGRRWTCCYSIGYRKTTRGKV